MRITDIKSRRHRFSALFLDGEPTLIDTETLLLSGYNVGDSIDDEQLHELTLASQRNRAYEKALYLLEYRAHSRKELFTKLRSVFPDEVCEHAIERVEELGLIDDFKFAEDFAEELFERKGFGERRVRLELEKRGISRDIVDDVLEDYDPEDVKESIIAVIKKKYRSIPEDEKNLARMYAGLSRMGYSYGDIRSAIDELRQ